MNLLHDLKNKLIQKAKNSTKNEMNRINKVLYEINKSDGADKELAKIL